MLRLEGALHLIDNPSATERVVPSTLRPDPSSGRRQKHLDKETRSCSSSLRAASGPVQHASCSLGHATLISPTQRRSSPIPQIFNDPSSAVHAALASRIDLSSRQLVWLERYSRHDPQRQYTLIRARIAQHPSCSARLERHLARIDRAWREWTNQRTGGTRRH